MQPIVTIGIILIGGLFGGELVSKLRLPRVTGYIIAGILLNPHFSHIIPEDFTNHTEFITNISLAFITFSVGGTLLLSRLKKLGKCILYITLLEAEFAFLAVALAFSLLLPFFIHINTATYLTVFIPLSLLLACLASPTDPSATLAVEHEYKARGEVSSTIMGVAALDDVLGIINYSIAVVLAGSFILHNSFTAKAIILKPIITIFGAILLGILFGLIFNLISRHMRKDTEGSLIVAIFGLIALCFGSANSLKVDELLATMTMGIIVVNFNKQQEKIFKILERYTEELIFALFFTLSGMHLDLNIFLNSFILVVIFFIFRTIGKISGTVTGAVISNSSDKIKRYVAGGLIPQGGIVIGLALLIKQNPLFKDFSSIVLNVIIGSTVIHELLGPLFSRLALKKAGEIKV